MEIIDELEPHRRGPYGGAVGYFDFGRQHGHLHRPADPGAARATAYVQAGAGIVADSVPAAEYEETPEQGAGR